MESHFRTITKALSWRFVATLVTFTVVWLVTRKLTFAVETVSQLLVQENVKMPDMVSVELNEQILKRAKFEETILKDDYKVEFLYFMGGGSVIN